MRFYQGQHRHTCGVDLHGRNLYLCILDEQGVIRLHKKLRCEPKLFLETIAPFRDDLVVGAECIFCWYWLADLCADEGIPFVLGHALYMKAIHGGKAKNDKIDSRKIAVLLRSGAFPFGYVYPRQMRATRDLLRRRLHFTRKRAELLTHIQNTFTQYNLPLPSGRLTSSAGRDGLAELFDDPAVQASIRADLSLLNHYDTLIPQLEHTALHLARAHDPHTLRLLMSIHGVGKILGLTLLYEIGDITRFPSAQDFSSYGRLIKCAKESDGKPLGVSGAKIGNAHIKWAFSEAAVCFLLRNPPGQAYLNRLRKKHPKGKALSVLAAKLGRATYFMLKHQTTFDMNRFLSH
jgi:transposase